MAFPNYPSGQAAAGTLLQLANTLSPETFSTVARITDINGPQMTVKEADTTSHSTVPSGGGPVWDTYIPTINSGGKVQLKLFIKTDNANDRLLASTFANRTINDWRIVEPDSLNSIIQFSAFITTFKLNHPIVGAVTADIELRITGAPTLFE